MNAIAIFGAKIGRYKAFLRHNRERIRRGILASAGYEKR